MYWKFILVNLLLVLSNQWILTSGTFEDLPPEDGDEFGARQSDDELIERIMKQLTHQNLGRDISQDLLDKKDQTVVQNSDSNNHGINFKSQDPNGDQTKNVNIPPDNTIKSVAEPSPPQPAQYSNSEGDAAVQAAPGPAAPGHAAPLQQQQNEEDRRGSKLIEADDKQFIIIVAVAVSAGFVGLMLTGVCYYKFRKSAKAASDVEYPVYGVTGPVKERIPSPGDRKLAQSAQMYHYQHQKQQMIAMEKANGDMKHDASEDDSEEDNIEGDYTVYECPGLAPTGEMEVRNPLFRGEDTPVTPGEDITGQPHGQDPSPEHGNQ